MASPRPKSPMSSKTPPPSLRTACPTTTADPRGSPGAAPSLHHPAILGSRGGSSTGFTRSSLLLMGTTGACTPIRGMRNVYVPSMRPDWVGVGLRDILVRSGDAVGSTDPSVTSGVAVSADVGAAAVGPTGAAPSSLEPQAAVTAARASPAMNRASPRGARLAGRDIGSGVMQEAAAGDHHGSGHH